MAAETPISLLERLRDPQQQEAWSRFVQLYTPLLHHWARRQGLEGAAAADLVQEVFLVLVRKLPAFRYDRQKSFRNWLRTVLINKARDSARRAGTSQEGGGTLPSDVASPDPIPALDEAEYRAYLVARALQLMQADFQPATWQACWQLVVESKPAAEVARELDLSLASVYAAKSRVLRRLRQELEGFLE
jgi:RNA polymerase sigma-70 factor (ECF subfamily)